MNKLFIVLTVACGSVTLYGQDAKKIFNEERIVFYGLDFSKAKIAIPDAKPSEIKDNYFVSWNETVVSDNARFNKESAFQKLKIYNDLTTVERRNAKVNVNEIHGSPDEGVLSKDAVEKIISDYTDGVKKEGVGFVFIVESFSKAKNDGVAHCVFFDIATRKVLLDKKLNAPPRGPGLKIYWTTPFEGMLVKMTDGLFDTWKKEIMGK
jgi:hypothetical protein